MGLQREYRLHAHTELVGEKLKSLNCLAVLFTREMEKDKPNPFRLKKSFITVSFEHKRFSRQEQNIQGSR